MRSETILWVVLVVWPLIALSLAWFLGRRGHDPGSWFVLGMLFGPLAIGLAIYAVNRERTEVEVIVASEDHADDRLDVLVGFDGSEESHAALRWATRLFGDRIDRLTLARIVPFDAGWEDSREARGLLLAEAEAVTGRSIGLEVIHGPPAAALQSVAHREGYDLIVIGTAAPHRVNPLGSAAKELAASSTVPVLVAPPDRVAPIATATG